MTTLAELGMVMDASQPEHAIGVLDQVADAGGRAETATTRLGRASAGAFGEVGRLADSARSASGAVDGQAAATGRATSAAGGMTSAVRAQEAAYSSAAAGATNFAGNVQTVEAALDRAGPAARSAAMSFNDFYEEAQRDFASQYVSQLNASQAALQGVEDQAQAAGTAAANFDLNVVRAAGGAKLAAHEAANLGRQFADIGTSLAGGMSPLMVLIQQGPQIADIAHSSGLGYKGMAREIALMLGILVRVGPAQMAGAGAAAAHTAANIAAAASAAGLSAADAAVEIASLEAAAAQEILAKSTSRAFAAQVMAAGGAPAVVAANEAIALSATEAAAAQSVALGPLALVLAAVAAAAAVLGIGLAVTAQQLNKTKESASELQSRLGLSDDQMKRLKKSGEELSVTMGDVLGGTFDFIGQKAAEAFHWDDIKSGIAKFYQDTVDWTVKSIRSMVGVWAGFQGGLHAMWKALPAAIGEFTIDAVNMAIRGVNRGLEWITDKVQKTIAFVNWVSDKVGLGLKLPDFKLDGLSEMANEFRGAGGKLGTAFSDGYRKEANAAMAQFDKDVAAWVAAIEARQGKRLKKKAGDANEVADKKGREEPESDYSKVMKQIGEKSLLTDKETASQKALNDAVAAGKMTLAEANREQAIAAEAAALRQAANTTDETQLKAIDDALKALRQSYKDRDAEASRNATLGVLAGQERTLEQLRLEKELIGATNVERAVRMAQLKEEQDIKAAHDKGYVFTDEDTKRVENAKAIARTGVEIAEGQERYNDALTKTEDLWNNIGDAVSEATDRLASAAQGMNKNFAGVVRGFGGILVAVSDLNAREAEIARVRDERTKGLKDTDNDYKLAVAQSTRAMREAQVNAYGDMAGAAKGFFKEGSAGYQVLEQAETAFRAVQFAMSIKAMIQNAAEAEAGQALSFKSAIANTIEGVSKAFGQMGVWGFVGAGAIIATMAALGVAVGNAGSGHSISAEENQKRQGTGGVLGDVDAKSESIANSLELVAANTNAELEYSNAMLRALRGIENNIGAVAAAMARALSVGGVLDEAAVKGLGSVNIDRGTSPSAWSAIFAGGGFDPGGLFAGTVTKKLVDQGLKFTAQSLGDLLSGGINASFFQTVETRQKEKAFGMTVKDSIKNKTTTTEIDADLARQLSLVVGSLRDGVLAAASVLGVEGADATLASMNIAIGQISLKGLKGQEITDALNAVFSKLGDDMAGTVIPGLTTLQKVGEGLFETLVRVARQYQVIDVTLSSIGMTFGAVGLSSLAAREHLIDLFGSMDDFADQVGFYADNFLSDAERLAPVQAALSAELARLGITGLDTRDEFKALVQGLDLSTAAGAELFAALMAIAPAFAAITEETKAVASARDDLSEAYDREASALSDTADRFRDLASGLGKYRSSLYSGPTAALSPEQQYLATKAEFERVAGLAAQGNEDALGDLQGVSQEYLDASRDYYASSQGYFDDLAAVRSAVTAAEGIAGAQVTVAEAQLDQLKASVAGILDLNKTTLTMAQALTNYTAAIAAAFGGSTQTPVVISTTGTVTTPATPTTPEMPATPAVPVSGGGGGGANDNAAVVQSIQGLGLRLQSIENRLTQANDQRAFGTASQLEKLDEQTDILDRTRQDLQARP